MEVTKIEKDKTNGIILTGFGKFGNILKNPTTFLVENLPEYLKANCQADFELIDARVVPVDIQNCDKAINEINEIISKSKNHFKRVFVIHMGVASGIQKMRIERNGCNIENFCIPDMAGNQPRNLPITEKLPKNGKLLTCLDVDSLQKKLAQEGFPCYVSDSAGQYICNYMYFCSLENIQKTGKDISSLFVHVGEFSDISKEIQLKFFNSLISEICC